MIGFMHIPKTGGSTVRKAMTEAGLSVWMPRGKWERAVEANRADLELWHAFA